MRAIHHIDGDVMNNDRANLRIVDISENLQPVVRNAVTCGICQMPADRYANRFECQDNPNHVGDLIVGIFSDLTPPA